MLISASLQACGVVFPFAMLTSICRSIVTICSGLYLLIGMTRFSSKWILSHSTWYKFRRSGQLLLGCLMALPFAPVWEEIAWRAFALRRLQCRYSHLSSALIIGVYWALWHVPLWLLTLSYLTPTLLLIICVNLISWSVIFSFLYDRSGQSLPVTILLHSTILTVQNLVFFAVMRGTIYIIPIAAGLSTCVA